MGKMEIAKIRIQESDYFGNHCRVNIRISHGDTSGGLPCEFFKSLLRQVVITHHNGYAIIPSLPDALHQGYLTQERNIVFFSKSFAPFFSENIILVTGKFFWGEIAHIFYQAYDWH